METKKTYKANIENKRTLLTEIGLVATMGIVLMAFEWGHRRPRSRHCPATMPLSSGMASRFR